ncbi:PD40 domain-containing protein [Winogradskyella echinorum]|uniref:PD40 domain-containing protein n=1 Tax=Winogradskyella echinorum TaxID=538189 RepID=A0ABR6XZH0_9FLAO|nr:PD40 domain-containing protein [Winogradskyella echinorum]MBC3845865.1 PD40 domain-containing protein [Winogradskyella echinorum]MBC5750213.1 PD40 domain-containing protein [Winogradskyella echinorum]
MKLINLLLFIVSFLVLISCKEKETIIPETTTKQIETTKNGVQPFAEHIFSKFTNVRDFTINSEENEAYFTLQSPARELSVIMKIEKKANEWQTPQICNFSGKYTDLEPFLSPDNLKLFFVSNRPIAVDSTNTKDMDIWYVERKTKTAAWSKPKNIGAPINTEADEFYPSVATNGNLYFTTIKKELASEDDIFMSKWKNNAYSEPTILGEGVNTKGAEYNAFIAPDESYIIFGGWRRPDALGSGDMYISKNVDGKWTTAENLGKTINSKGMEFCPFVMNGTLYFTSRRSNVTMNEDGFSDAEELFSEINKYDNGASRIYQVDFKTFISQ